MLRQANCSDTSAFVIDRADRWGLFLSGLCALHCLVLPTVVSAIPFVIVTQSSTTPLLQITAFSLSSLVAFRAVSAGYRMHRSRSVVSLAIAGVALQIGSVWMQSCQCRAMPSAAHAADCPCREICGWKTSECRLVPTRSAVSAASFAMSWISPTGAILLVIAHSKNWQLRKSHRQCL